MLQSFIIVLREGFESFLLVAVIFSYLRRSGQKQLTSAVYAAIGVAVAISAALGYLLFQMQNDPLVADHVAWLAHGSDEHLRWLYRNCLFTCNLHGNRVNRDRIDYTAKGPVLRHEKDFLFANDPWFRGLAIDYGPDGGVYVADWCDTGECHNAKEVDRTNGRIYKVTHSTPKPKRLAAWTASAEPCQWCSA